MLVIDNWLNTYGNTELLKYDFRESNTSFDELKQIQSGGQALGRFPKKGIAKLDFIIWKEKHIFEDVPCNDSDYAEVLSVFALLMKCKQEQFSLVEVWSDSARACGVMTGSQTIKMSLTTLLYPLGPTDSCPI